MAKKGILFLFLFMAAFYACQTVPITGRRQISLIPKSQLTSLSNVNFKELIGKSKLSTDAEKIAMVERSGKKITKAAEQFLIECGMGHEIGNYNWEFKLIDDPKTVNAFCMPGGKVAVYTGILPLTKDEEGLAVVIGHEVAHAIANHGNERMSQLLLMNLGGLTLARAMEKEPKKTQQLMLAAYGLGSQFGMLLPYSRKHEYEADKIGLILMARSGYNPSASVSFWERMSKLGGNKPPEFLSTHPSSSSRIAKLKEELPGALRYYKK